MAEVAHCWHVRMWLIDNHDRDSKALWEACETRFGYRVADSPAQFLVLVNRLYATWRSLSGRRQLLVIKKFRVSYEIKKKTVNGAVVTEIVVNDPWEATH